MTWRRQFGKSGHAEGGDRPQVALHVRSVADVMFFIVPGFQGIPEHLLFHLLRLDGVIGQAVQWTDYTGIQSQDAFILAAISFSPS